MREEGYDDQYLKMIEQYFPGSVLFIVRHRGELIGAARLLNPEISCRVMDFWNLDYPNHVDFKELRELGMLAVDKRYRGKSRLPITGLIEVGYQYSLKNGIRWWLSSATRKKFEKFRTMNASCRELDKLPPTDRQHKFQSVYSEFFDSFDTKTVLFIFDLNHASYSAQLKRMIQRKFDMR